MKCATLILSVALMCAGSQAASVAGAGNTAKVCGAALSENVTSTFAADPDSCDMYHLCTSWFSCQLACPTGEHFSEVLQKCTDPCTAACDPDVVCTTTGAPTTDPATEADAITTEGEAVATEGEAVATEGEAVATEGEAVATEGEAVATEGEAVATEGEAVATEGEAVATEGEAVATEGEAVATEGEALATEGEALATEGEAVATEGEALATEGEALATEAADVTTDAPVTTEAATASPAPAFDFKKIVELVDMFNKPPAAISGVTAA